LRGQSAIFVLNELAGNPTSPDIGYELYQASGGKEWRDEDDLPLQSILADALCSRASSVASSCNISADVLVVWFFDITASVQMP
jgi:hypothetical protein